MASLGTGNPPLKVESSGFVKGSGNCRVACWPYGSNSRQILDYFMHWSVLAATLDVNGNKESELHESRTGVTSAKSFCVLHDSFIV